MGELKKKLMQVSLFPGDMHSTKVMFMMMTLNY